LFIIQFKKREINYRGKEENLPLWWMKKIVKKNYKIKLNTILFQSNYISRILTFFYNTKLVLIILINSLITTIIILTILIIITWAFYKKKY